MFKQIGQLDEIFASLLWGDESPGCLKGLAGDGDGMVNIFFCGFVDRANGLLRSRIDAFESFAILAFDELVVDETAMQGGSISFAV